MIKVYSQFLFQNSDWSRCLFKSFVFIQNIKHLTINLFQKEKYFMKYNELDKDSIPQSPGIDRKRVIRSEDIFQKGKEVIIQHGTESYRLLITKTGKLILNK